MSSLIGGAAAAQSTADIAAVNAVKSHILNDTTILTKTGTATLPAQSDVKATVHYGVGGNGSTGSYVPTGGTLNVTVANTDPAGRNGIYFTSDFTGDVVIAAGGNSNSPYGIFVNTPNAVSVTLTGINDGGNGNLGTSPNFNPSNYLFAPTAANALAILMWWWQNANPAQYGAMITVDGAAPTAGDDLTAALTTLSNMYWIVNYTGM